MFNWSCYMNHLIARGRTTHVHWWAVPRYDHPCHCSGQISDDLHLGSPYDHERFGDHTDELKAEVVARLRRALA